MQQFQWCCWCSHKKRGFWNFALIFVLQNKLSESKYWQALGYEVLCKWKFNVWAIFCIHNRTVTHTLLIWCRKSCMKSKAARHVKFLRSMRGMLPVSANASMSVVWALRHQGVMYACSFWELSSTDIKILF